MTARVRRRAKPTLQTSRSPDVSRAKRLLTDLVGGHRDPHPRAAASLEEVLDETRTVKRLDISSKLERQLSTTNAIENWWELSADLRAA
jgi:hypothetical protein